MVLKEGQLQPIKAAVPVEVGIGTNAEQRRATCSASKCKEVQDAAQMGVVPATDQQHRALQ